MIGQQIANYRIEAKLGEGGMGVVYKAIDVTLDRPVALKLISSELARDPALIARFQAEAKAQANLNHTNIATLYSFMNVDGNWLMVMEYVEGETVDQIIRRRGLIPYQEAVPLFKQALLGIGFAHRMGIIHRDIKPSNIMVNRNGIVKVMDFGIAKALGGRGLTRTGMQMGTVSYMSPEQIRNQPVDIRSDIYALGATLYEMLTAHVPFEGESDFQVMSDHVNTPPPRPTRHYPYVPSGIEGAVLKALEKNPDQRFQTVEEFGAALESPGSIEAAVPQPTVAAGTTAVQRTPTPAPRPGLPPTVVSATASQAATAVSPSQPPTGFWTRGNQLIALGGAGVLALVLVVLVAVYRQSTPKAPVGGLQGSSGGGGGTLIAQQSNPGPPGPTQTPGPDKTPAAQTTDEPKTGKPSAIEELPLRKTSKPPVENPRPGGELRRPPSIPEPPKVDPSLQYLRNAEAAFSSGRLLDPPNDSAVYWAQQAKRNGNPEAERIEQRVVGIVLNQVQAARASKNYDLALSQLSQLMAFYPASSDLQSLRTSLQSEKEQYVQRRQYEAQLKRYTLMHRHVQMGANFNMVQSYCTGVLSITPDGMARFDCTQTTDPTGRCDRVSFAPGSIKQVKINRDGSLHIATQGMGNFDFYGQPDSVQGAYQAMTSSGGQRR